MKQLRPEDLPPPNADWDTIQTFALTFRGDIHECGKIANRRDAKTLTELRASLFFEQRQRRHLGEVPTEADLVYIQSLVEKIRAHLTSSGWI